jgi:phage replication-related protein YjqB (UPF0714/DUF867 family)
MFAELLAEPGVVEHVELRSRVGVMAFHGGSLERRTDAIASAVASHAGASLYAVALPEDLRWHVPSKHVDPAESPALAAFVDHVDVAIAVHGYGREGWWTAVLLGGSNRALAEHLGAHLTAALPAYRVVDDLALVPADLRGLHPDNPVNRPRQGGVQVELPPRVRGLGPRGTVAATAALIDGLAAAVVGWRAPV